MEEKKERKKFKMITPEEAWQKFINWFDIRKRLAFLVTLFVGIVTHITIITEMVMSQDGLWNSIQYFRPGAWETTLGRWGIAIVERLNNFIAIPTVATISCLLAMAIAVVFLIDIFDLKSKLSIILTSLVVAVTPTLTITLLYIYTAFAYCFNFLISVLVIWFLYKFKYKKIGFFLSALCFMFSLSIYQSYIGVSIGLCAMVCILNLVRNTKTIKEVLIDILKAIAVVLVGGALYYIITMIVLDVLHLELSDTYKGTQGISILGILSNLPNTILQTYQDFFVFFFKDTIVYNSNYRREVMFLIFFAMFCIAFLVSAIFIKGKTRNEKILKAILSILFLLVIPICLNIIDIILVGNIMYALTTVQMILMIPFALAIFENINNFIIIKWIAIIFCLGIILTYYIADNVSYSAMKLTYNQAYSTAIRIVDRMETAEGYKKEYPVLFGGIVGDYNYPRTSSLYNYSVGSIVLNPAFHGSYNGSVGTWVNFLKIYCGLDVVPCSADVYYRIVNSEEYKQMENFPGETSVKVINGIVVVKFTENPDLPF